MTDLSIAIPTYEYHGNGAEVLEHSFRQLEDQTFRNFNIVISDHSIDREIFNLCFKWNDKLNIEYHSNKNDRGNASANTWNSIIKSTGRIIKLLCQDDYIFDKHSLGKIVNSFQNPNVKWVASAYLHTYNRQDLFKLQLPRWNSSIHTVNTIGSPSCIAILNMKDIPEMDKNLGYAYDCEWYYRLSQVYGEPKILSEITMVNFLWDESVSSKITPEFIAKENNYILGKHGFLQ